MRPTTSPDRPPAAELRTDRARSTGTLKKNTFPRLTKRRLSILAVALVAVAASVGGFLTRNWWLPKGAQLVTATPERFHDGHGSQEAVGDDHDLAEGQIGQAHASHDHPGHDEATSLCMLSRERFLTTSGSA